MKKILLMTLLAVFAISGADAQSSSKSEPNGLDTLVVSKAVRWNGDVRSQNRMEIAQTTTVQQVRKVVLLVLQPTKTPCQSTSRMSRRRCKSQLIPFISTTQ